MWKVISLMAFRPFISLLTFVLVIEPGKFLLKCAVNWCIAADPQAHVPVFEVTVACREWAPSQASSQNKWPCLGLTWPPLCFYYLIVYHFLELDKSRLKTELLLSLTPSIYQNKAGFGIRFPKWEHSLLYRQLPAVKLRLVRKSMRRKTFQE